MEGFGVVGLNDCHTDSYTQITLVTRRYIEKQSGVIDDPNTLYHRGYHHNYVDTEFSLTAMKRNQYKACPESLVEHKHYSFNKSEFDETYRKTISRAEQDKQLFESRKHLFS